MSKRKRFLYIICTVLLIWLVSYAGIMATETELQLQNSHFQRDLAENKKRSSAQEVTPEPEQEMSLTVDCTLPEAYSLLFATSTTNKKASSAEDEE